MDRRREAQGDRRSCQGDEHMGSLAQTSAPHHAWPAGYSQREETTQARHEGGLSTASKKEREASFLTIVAERSRGSLSSAVLIHALANQAPPGSQTTALPTPGCSPAVGAGVERERDLEMMAEGTRVNWEPGLVAMASHPMPLASFELTKRDKANHHLRALDR